MVKSKPKTKQVVNSTELITQHRSHLRNVKPWQLEKQILKALLQLREEMNEKTWYPRDPFEGNNIEGLIKLVYSPAEIELVKKRNGYGNTPYQPDSIKVSMCRALNALFRKGLVKKCHPLSDP